MVFEKRTQRREDRAQEIIDTPEVEDVSIFPMAMPMIAGTGFNHRHDAADWPE